MNTGVTFLNDTDAIFAVDVSSGRVYWDWDGGAASTITNNGTLNKTGTGILDISNYGSIDLVNTGVLNINAGRLDQGRSPVNRGIVNIATDATYRLLGAPSNAEGAIIAGTGTLDVMSATSDLFTNHGIIAPGSSAGTLNILGNLTLSATSILDIELAGTTTAGEDYDLLVVSGTANLGGTLRLTEIDGFASSVNDTFEVMTYAGRTGAFSTIDQSFGDTYAANPEGATSVLLSVTENGNFISWDGGAGTLNWTDMDNWSGNALPGLTDDVHIGAATGSVLLSGSDEAIRRIDVADGQSLTLGSLASLDLASSSTVSTATGTFNLSGGTLRGAGDLTVAGLFNWLSGTLDIASLISSGTT
ncbi:MAG: hypothetical protein GY731_01945, partial [Gammaproteobacteria bacterium]|nr:hypothetical protein [Gammaproteobacteria bacterium]